MSGRQRITGFTLLELLLALGLTVVIMSAIMSAIHLYLLQLDRHRIQIEQKQISRGVVRMVSEDLRAAIQYKAEDYSGLENLIASQSLAGIGGLTAGVDPGNIDADQLEQGIIDAVTGGGETGGGDADGGITGEQDAEGVGNEEDDGSGESSEEGQAADEEEELGRPALIGNNGFIRIDTSRLPRLHEYNPLVVSQGAENRLPSDIKTITYFYHDSAPVIENPVDRDFGKNGGLYRRQIDRAVESYQNDGEDVAIVAQPDEYSELIAPEIAGIQFRYWDGEQWLAEWDSAENGGFPSAIEVRVIIDPERIIERESDKDVQAEVESVRTVVHLPVAEVMEEEQMEDDQ